jgi:hypothetical protein
MPTEPLPTFPAERIERKILLIRGQKAILDADLADLYGVETRALKQAVRRNRDRFPDDFMVELTWEEAESVRKIATTAATSSRSQTVILKRGSNIKYLPLAFTEQGVAMLSSVLRSPRAIQANIAIMRAFVRVREMLATHKDVARKLEALERKYDGQFQVVFEAIRQLMLPAPLNRKRRTIGFGPWEPEKEAKKP